MGDVVLRHGQYGYHGDGAGVALYAARPLVHGGKVGIQVAGVAAAAGNLLAGGGYLTEGLRVVGYIRDYYQHVHAKVVCKILRGGERHAGSGYALYGGVVGEVYEGDGTVYGAGGPEVGGEKVRLLKGYAYGGEYYREALAGAPHLSLTGYLGRKVCVGQAGA